MMLFAPRGAASATRSTAAQKISGHHGATSPRKRRRRARQRAGRSSATRPAARARAASSRRGTRRRAPRRRARGRARRRWARSRRRPAGSARRSRGRRRRRPRARRRGRARTCGHASAAATSTRRSHSALCTAMRTRVGIGEHQPQRLVGRGEAPGDGPRQVLVEQEGPQQGARRRSWRRRARGCRPRRRGRRRRGRRAPRRARSRRARPRPAAAGRRGARDSGSYRRTSHHGPGRSSMPGRSARTRS